MLSRTVAALRAAGGAVWTVGPGGGLALCHQLKLYQADAENLGDVEPAHMPLLQRVLAGRQAVVVPPHSGSDDGPGANPFDLLLLLAPLATELESVGVLEIHLRPDTTRAVQQSQHRLLLRVLEHAGDYLKNRQLRSFSHRQTLWNRLEEFARTVHATLDPRQTAYTIANEARRLIDCDRVSVAVCRGRKCVVQSVSGQDLIDRRSNSVRLLEKLAAAVVATGEPLWYTGDCDNMAPQLERAVGAYVDQTQAKAVGVLPLRRGRPDAGDGEEPQDHGNPQPPIGAVIVERIEDSRVPADMLRRVEAVCRHSAGALANALEHHSLFLMPLWRALGRARWVVRARTLPKTLAVAAAVAALAAWLLLWPADLELEARGSLQPVLRRDVFAGIDGRVEEVHVDHRDRVQGPGKTTGKQGTLLASLANNDLEEELARITGQRSTTRQQISSIQRSLLEENLTVPEQNRLSGDLAELRQKLGSLDAQWDLLQKKREELAVRSPTGGEVVTWDVRSLLVHRPVRRGQRLMRIADTGGPWQLELHVPEDRMGHIVEARKQLRGRAGEDAGQGLRVSFILATDPGAEYEGTIKEIHHSAEVRGEEGNTVLVTVQIDKTELSHLMPGAGVIAKIHCGQCSVGYDLFHDVLAWLERLRFRF